MTVKIVTDYEDGRHYAAERRNAKVYTEVSRVWWWAFCLHNMIDRAFQRRLRDIDNEQFEREHPEEK